ncbi:MAG: hypothetical protein F6K54_14710 [Okeania sp. SIO3B5]|uniref:hypothetical protein n=1 Tax=Okeania sp. SIO3B5 TaxID=2607811 RepID=UPI0013FF0A21|nr:hypothetical protein [Okeania sp. SIO3B5]NEO54222.1 hypothetical protein [Okeania sp. SIO3B5]
MSLKDGDKVLLQNDLGEFQRRVYLAPIKPGNLQVHWSEGNVLLDQFDKCLLQIARVFLRIHNSESIIQNG